MPDSRKKLKRYAITVDLYIYAESDAKALNAARHFCESQRKQNDNQCHLQSLSEIPFGKIAGERSIEIP